MVGDPKVSFFFFLNLRIRRFACAKAHMPGAHPWVVRSNFLDRYAMGTKEGPSWWPRIPRAYPSSVTEREKGRVGSGRCSSGFWRSACGTSERT